MKKFSNKYLTFIVCYSILVFVSCNKTKYPGAQIIAPSNGQVFTAPEIVKVTANLKDDGDALTTQILYVVKENIAHDTVVNFKEHKFLHGLNVIEKSFTTETNTSYKIITGARGGHGNSKYDSIIVKAN